ncbi:hypothetical protein TraAM80_03538 [Trypanosoma rangeli]|uniref:Uncharacterized protein n=1 Tax=Trypanosoma rangeli TaxID=5698 RepID=A0A422NP50_TRYRA|nr:uncharacterized protein TraAM80_03538 [Trypanosoma rangeli]RNF07169.1 hypothetical protein TraAM80_03538 [Trypanosoma rangeli]|eukprot:RNF07169.1 hypothetical protein TraAM80_03538 [Trypanosoma rangeli]
MNVITFAPFTQLCLGSGKKPGYARVVASRRVGAVEGKKPEVAAVFLDEKRSKLRVWCEHKGITTLRGAGKYSSRIVDTASDGLFTALFFHHDKGRRLGLAIVQFNPLNATHLAGDPVDYSDDLDAVLIPLVPCEKKSNETTAQLQIHCSSLKLTASGLVVSLLVSTRGGERYLIIGSIGANKWKCFCLDAAFGLSALLSIQSDRIVSVLSCEVGPPVDHTILTVSPTVELALSVFEATRMVSDDNEKKTYLSVQSAGVQCCVVLRETIFSLDDGDPIIRVWYQSQLFHPPEGQGGARLAPLCRIYADHEQQRYAIVVSFASQSYLVHLRRSPFNMELVAGCTKIGLQSLPHSVLWLRLMHPSRSEGGLQIVLVLSQDYRIYAAEVFGSAINVVVENGDNTVRFTPPARSCFGSDHTVESSTDSPCLIRVGESELLCSNGLLAVVLRVAALAIDGEMPRELLIPLTIENETSERRVVTLLKSLSRLEKVSNLSRSELLQLTFQQVLPMLRLAGSSQHEVFLTQRVFQALLNAAAPTSASDWRTMWGITMLLQRILSKRDLDNCVVYTDIFFIHLVDNYVRCNGTVDEQAQASETLLSVVSEELKCAWKRFMQQQDEDVSFVLDSLAERVSLISLAEECVRRMVVVTTLSNGTHVVSVGERVSHVIHAIATALLASCLEVPVYVNKDDAGRMVCQMHQVGDTSLFLPPSSFKNRTTFEYALTLSTDILSVTSPDTHATLSARALLSMLLSRRYHVVSAFLCIFTAPLTEYLMPLGSICDNAQLITECSAAAFLTEAALFKKILSEPVPSDVLCVLCAGSVLDDYFNTELWCYIGNVLSKDTQFFIVVAVIHAMTDRMIAAQNNYSASVAKALLKEGLENPLQEEVTVETCRKRLGIILERLEHAWACAAPWLPYKVKDIASSVLTINGAEQDGNHDGQTICGDSVVSHTCILCFRLLALIGYSYRTEEHITELTKQVAGDTSVLVHVAFLLLQAITNLKGTALPVDSLRWRCVDLAAMALPMCTGTPGLAGFMREMLQYSEAALTVIAPLKQYYYTVVDHLTEVAQADGNAGAGAAFHELQAQITVQKKNSPTTTKTTTYFRWSKCGGAVVPEWPGNHNLLTRRYLINTEWVDAMWPIEFVPQLLADCLTRTQERICGCNTTIRPAEGEPSPQFSYSLFHQLCKLSPPVRNHALIAPIEAASEGAKRSELNHPQEIRRTGDHMAPSSTASTSVAIAPSMLRRKTSPEAGPHAESSPYLERNDDGLVGGASTLLSPPVREVRSLPRFLTKGGDTSAAAAAATALFPPESIAWWETDDALDEAAGRQRVIRETLQDINPEFTTTATSYTRATSEGGDNLSEKFDRKFSSSSFSPRRCRKHHVHHYRCAKHRAHGIHTKEWYHLRRQSRHGNAPAGMRSPEVSSLAAIKEEAAMNVKLLQFKHVLQPPNLPSSVVPTDKIQLVQPRLSEDTNDVAPLQLLSLKAKPHRPRVKLFAWSGAETNDAEVEGNGAGAKNVGPDRPHGFLVGTSSHSQLLEPPSLPPSSVFLSPSPLLTLKFPVNVDATHRKPVSQAAVPRSLQEEERRVGDTEEPLGPIPAPTVNVPITSASLKQQQNLPTSTTALSLTSNAPSTMPPFAHHESSAGFMLSGAAAPVEMRNEEAELRESSKQQVALAPTTSRSIFPASVEDSPTVFALKKPVLPLSETAAFYKYVDELKAADTAAVPVPLPLHPAQSLPASTPPVMPTGVTSKIPESLQQQQRDIIGVVKELLAKHEEQQAKQFNGVIEAIRTSTQRPPTPVVSAPVAVQQTQGLNATEQAALVRHTIQQKDKLLMMNQDLLDLHARAERLTAAPVKNEATSFASPHILVDSEKTRQVTQPTVSLAVPVQLATTTPAKKSEVATVSSGVQVGVGVKRMEDAATMAVTPVAPPPPAAAVTTAIRMTPAPQVTDETSSGVKNMVPDPSSTMSINHSLSSLYQLNAELLRVNATAGDMERAIQESRAVLHKHASLNNAYASAVEGSLMVDAMRQRTAALEQQLTVLNSTAADPPSAANQSMKDTLKWHALSESEEIFGKHVFVSSTVESGTTGQGNEGGARETLPPRQFAFTGEKVEAECNGFPGFGPPAPLPVSKEQASDHVFQSHTEETLRKDSLPVNPGTTETPSGALHTPAFRSHRAKTASIGRDPSPSMGRRGNSLQRRSGASLSSPVVDLGDIYTAAESSFRQSAARRSMTPARTRAGVTSPSQRVPERFFMYIPPADAGKTRRANDGCKTASPPSAPRHRSMAIESGATTAMTIKTVNVSKALTVAPKHSTRKAPSSGRDSKRRETLALHTSKRLAELNRAFL